MALDKYRALVEAADKSEICVEDLRALRTMLPASDEELDEVLAGLVENRKGHPFLRLLLSALDAGRTPAASVLVRGVSLMPAEMLVPTVAARCTGDVASALVAAARDERISGVRRSVYLLTAAWWVREKAPERSMADIVQEALAMARKKIGLDAALWFGALADYLGDASLFEALGHAEFPNSAFTRDARKVQEQALSYTTKPVLEGVWPTRGDIPRGGHTIRRAVPKIGRNEPCHCGSGKKYKKCCEEKDKERLRDSSDTPGVTWSEMREQPEAYLTAARVHSMSGSELAQLDPLRVPQELLRMVLNRLTMLGEAGTSARFLETLGFSPDLEGQFDDALSTLAHEGDAVTLRRLAALVPEERRNDLLNDPGVRLALIEEPAGPMLELIEAEAKKTLDQPIPFAGLAFALMAQRFPALGVAVARSAIVSGVGPDDVETLLDTLLETRARIGLQPQDVIEPLAERLVEAADDETSLREELAAHRKRLAEKGAETRSLRDQICRLQQDADKRQRELAAASAAIRQATVHAESKPAEDPQLSELRRRLALVKEELKSRHDERNELRRELERARQELAERDAAETSGASAQRPTEERELEEKEERLLAAGGLEEAQPLRIPVFPMSYLRSTERLPLHVRKSAIQLAGRMASGDRAAFHGARRLDKDRLVVRQKVHKHYRLLCRLETDRLVVLDLIPRCELERRLETL